MTTAVGTLSGIRSLPAARPASEFDVREIVKGFVFVGGALLILGLVRPFEFSLLAAVVLLAVWSWRAPIRGLYVLLGAAAMIEIFALDFPDSVTDRVPFFINLNDSTSLQIPITPAEIFMLTVGLVSLARGAAERKLRWPSGRLVTAYGLYLAIVVGAEIHGLAAGGDFKTSLWEMRPQAYGFILFFLTVSLVETRAQMVGLAIVFLLSASVKAVIGDFRYFVTVQGILTHETVLAHEDSYFLAMFVTATLAAAIWLRNRRLIVSMSLMSAIAFVAMLANYRRAGVYALIAALGVLVLLAFRYEPPLRKAIGWISVALVIAGAAFVFSAWDKQYGVQGQLVRPIRSLVDPSARDYSSDQYRVAETANLQLTFRTSPIFGVGFGSPFLIVYPMADISSSYSLWNVIPHNSLMWIGMRMGTVGFAAFWALVGLAVLEGMNVLANRRDPLLRAIAAFAIAAVVAEIVVGYADLQLENYRNLIFLGVVLGVLNRMSLMPDESRA